jgi:decaprenyl-phosphate phosphoribosyltransferase
MPPASAPSRVFLPPRLVQSRLRLAAPLAPARERPGTWPLVRACRPRQWLKNVLVLIAPATAGVLGRASAVPALLGAFAAFCLMASATYLINDVRDRDCDRRHPRKRTRPIAAGEVSVRAALALAAGLGLTSLIVAMLVGSMLAIVVGAYAALTFSYSLLWREVVYMDVIVIAGGFVFRAVAGGAAVNVPLSPAFLIVTSACAVFLVAGKRHAELVAAGGVSAARTTLQRYSRRGLRLLLVTSAGLACVAYTGWSLNRPAAGAWLGLSLVPFVLWIGRYAALVRAGAGEAPEELVLRDTGLVALSLVWTLLFVTAVYGPG